MKWVNIWSPSSSSQEEGMLFQTEGICCLAWIKTSGSLRFSVTVWLSWASLWHTASTEPYGLRAVSKPFQRIPLPTPRPALNGSCYCGLKDKCSRSFQALVPFLNGLIAFLSVERPVVWSRKLNPSFPLQCSEPLPKFGTLCWCQMCSSAFWLALCVPSILLSWCLREISKCSAQLFFSML